MISITASERIERIGKKIGIDLPYFIRGGFWVTIKQGVLGVSNILVAAVFVRFASQETFGQFQYLLSILATLSILSLPGFNTAIIQSVARGHEGDYQRVVRKSLQWSLLAVPILLLGGGYYYHQGQEILGICLMISSIFFPSFYSFLNWDSFLQGKSRFDLSAKFGTFQTVINSLTTIATIYFSGDNLIYIFSAHLFSYSLMNFIFYRLSLRYRENTEEDAEVMGYGWFLTKVSFLNLLANNIDKLLIGTLLGPVNLAIYTVISLIAIKAKDLAKPFSAMLLPKLSRSNNRLADIYRQHKQFLYLLILLQVVSAVVFYFAIPVLNTVLFTAEYDQYAHLAQLFAITVLFLIPQMCFGYYIEARKSTFSIIVANPVFLFLKVGVTYACIRLYGLEGAVWAYNITFVLWFFSTFAAILYEERKLA